MNSLRRAQRLINDAHNVKFDAHLKNFGETFEQALLRIKDCNLEKKSIKSKFMKYDKLFSMGIEQMKMNGISPTNLLKIKMQFKQRFMTLKRAIKELEENFGILVVKRKLAKNGIKGNDKASTSPIAAT